MTQTLGSSIMKKTMKFIGLIAMAAVLFSCEKKIDTETVIVDTTPDEAAVDGSLLKSFGATFENQTKVSVDIETGDTSLEIGDVALVFVSSTNYAEYKFDGTAFVPKGENAVELSSTASVYYPREEFEVDGETVKFVMPGGIKASESLGAIAPMAGVITQKEGDYSVEFKNLASILRVKVTADVNIASVTLSFGESQKYAQNAKFIVNAVNSTMEFSNASGASGTSVSLNPVAKEADVIFLLPTIALPEGLEVTANLTEDNNGGVKSYTVTNASTNAPVRNSISKMSFYAGLFSGGAGTSDDPYKIATARDFRNLITYSSKGCPQCSKNASDFLGANYLQTANIDFKKVKMSPIGDSDHQFSGQYDGDGKQLQNVNINETGQFAGIFAYVNGSASIKDLTVSGNITKTGSTDNSCAGGIAGIVRGAATVTGCTNNATITSSATYTGGIAGRLYQSTSSTAISGCTNNGSVTSSVSYTGGIVGQQIHGGTIVECVNNGTVSGTSYVGGIVGDMGAAGAAPSAISFISFCRNDATINASANCSGGIAGRIINGSVVSSCFAKGTVSSESYDVGGIAGLVQVNNSNANSRVCVYDCLTAVNVTTTRSGASNEARTGGAVGFVSNNQAQFIAIDNCGVIATSVTVGGGTKVGGFVGRFASSNSNKNRTRIRNSYTLVSSISSPNSLYGGFVGNAESYGELHYCYYVADDSNVNINSNTTQDNLTKKTADEIASSATCEAFNANSYVLTIDGKNYGSSLGWAIPAGCDYPVPGSLISMGQEYYK